MTLCQGNNACETTSSIIEHRAWLRMGCANVVQPICRYLVHDCGQELIGKWVYFPEQFEWGWIWYAYREDEDWMVGHRVCPACHESVEIDEGDPE